MYEEILKGLEKKNFNRSAWDRAVNIYACELLDNIDDIENISNVAELKKATLNGAENFKEYSYGGCSLISDVDIARRCCTPSEFKRTKEGNHNPNSRENWLDVQARALNQAYKRIENSYKKIKSIKKFDDIESITGYIIIKPNQTWGCTVRCSERTIEFKDGTKKNIIQNSRAYTHSGCGYDKVEWAIHTTLDKYVSNVKGGGFYIHKEYNGAKNLDLFRTHFFEFDLENISVTVY